MSALIELGLSDLHPEPASISVNGQLWLDRFKTVDEWLKKVFEGIEKLPDNLKNIGEVGKLLEQCAPWIEAGAKAFPPAHLLFEVVSALTKINDPRDLAILACTVAYQTAAEKAIREASLPERKSISKRIRDSIGVTRNEFSYFTIEGALTHPFIRRADDVLEFYASQTGYTDRQIERLIGAVHGRFREELRLLISDGENQEKFAPLRNWLGTDAKEALSREALRRHVQYISWLFEEAPLLDEEPYALKNIYIDTGCGVLTRKELQEKDKNGRPARDPFRRSEKNGGVYGLLGKVLEYIRDPDFNDVIIVQGAAGAGKSSFTKHLATTLALDGLTPLLVRLRDAANIGQGVLRTIGDALRYEDEVYLRGTHEHFQPPPELLGNGSIFNEDVTYYGVSICPCVLILDGWDEISLDVSVGYKQKVQALLLEIRQEFFRERHARVRIVLTGRPSDAIDTAESFFNDNTPVLTVRSMTPEQLIDFAAKVREGVNNRPLQRYTSSWNMPSEEELKPLFARYRAGFEDNSVHVSEEVLGVPFLAQLAFRVIADPGADGDRVAVEPTTLLRRITEITVHNARLSTENMHVDGQGRATVKSTGKKLYGDPLRKLLHKTAAKMTIAGRESISHRELSNYLHASNDQELIDQAEGSGGISGLLIAFFFKGGNTHLGCEFTHKALREYLFAEAVVECIKQFADHAEVLPTLTVRPHYWRDFDDSDPRQEWSRNLAELLAPQWLTFPVRLHIQNLLRWEIARISAAKENEDASNPLKISEWVYIRDAMADVYSWWADGVPMRPQLVTISKKNETDWSPPHFQTLIEQQFDRPAKSEILSVVAPRLATYDGHFGSALMQLTAAIHVSVRTMVSRVGLRDTLRDRSVVQSQKVDQPVAFRPCGDHLEYFRWYCGRINTAGWYNTLYSWSQDSLFPSGAYLNGVDLSGANLSRLDFSRAALADANLSRAYINSADLTEASLEKVDLSDAYLVEATLNDAFLTGANLTDAHLSRASLAKAILNGSNLTSASLLAADLSRADLSYATLIGAELTRSDLTGAYLRNADLTNADLSEAILIAADFTDAELSQADLRRARLDAQSLSDEQLAFVAYKPNHPNG